MPTDYTTPTYTAPAASSSDTSWIDWARLANEVRKGFTSNDPKFKNVPMSPEEKKLYDIYLKGLMNPALQDNAGKVDALGNDILGGYKDLKWTSPPTFGGQQGYGGTGAQQSPYGPQSSAPAGPPPPITSKFVDPMEGTTPSGLRTDVGFKPMHPQMPSDPNGNPNAPAWGEDIGAWMGRGGGQDGVGYEKYFPTTGGPMDPNRPGEGKFLYNGEGTNPTWIGSGNPNVSYGSLTNKAAELAGKWNPNQETYEKWIARGASAVASFYGLPLPPAIAQKGIDAIQWLFGKLSGRGGAPATPPASPTIPPGGAPDNMMGGV